MNIFVQKIVELFAHDLPMNLDSEIPVYLKLDTVSRFICQKLKASCVSILLYSGQEDRLNCRGRYINSRYVTTPSDSNHPIRKILEKICIYSYINSIKKLKREKTVDNLFKEFESSKLASMYLTMENFFDIFERYEDWKYLYKKYVQTITSEYYNIGDENTLTGIYYQKILDHEPDYEATVHLVDLNNLQPKSFHCLNPLKDVLGITLNARYYVALPLFANHHYFGVLRILFPAETESIQFNEKGELKVVDEKQSEIESIAHIVSLHLENYYILNGYKKIYFSSKKHAEQFPSIEAFLNYQCDRLSEIIESRGAIIRFWDEEKKKMEIAGFSKNIINYADKMNMNENPYFEKIVNRLMEEKNILGVHFNTLLPLNVVKYIGNIDQERLHYFEEEWPLQNQYLNDLPEKLEEINVYNVAIMPIPNIERSYIAFLNSQNRKFLSKDIEMIYPAIKNLGLELESYYFTKNIVKRMDIISAMHDKIFNSVTDKYVEGNQYVKTFLEIIGETILGLKIFTHHIAWEYISEDVPNEFKRNDFFFFRNITHSKYEDVPYIKKTGAYQPTKRSIFEIRGNGKNSEWKYSTYFLKGPLKKIIELNLEDGYSYFDLPFYHYNAHQGEEPKLVGIFSLVFKDSNQSLVNEPDFLNFMQFLSKQITIAWENLEESIAESIQKKIDDHIRTNRKSSDSSNTLILTEITKMLANVFSSDLCTFFLHNEKNESLELVASNIPFKKKVSYNIQKDKDMLTVQSFICKKNYRIFGRSRLEEIAKTTQLQMIEDEVKSKIIEKFKANAQERGVNFKYSNICIEHWQSQVICIGEQKVGLFKLYQFKGIDSTKHPDRFKYKRHPFSEFETNLLLRIQKHIFNVIITQKTIQQRIEDMRLVLHQVVAPMNALITQCQNLIDGIVPIGKLPGKYMYLRQQSRMAVKYARNFQGILDIDTGNIVLKRKKIDDLRRYLISKAIDFQPLAKEEKQLQIYVPGEGRESVSIELDNDLFDHVITNLLNNAVKYSFDKEGRADKEIKEPENPEDSGNIVLSAREREGIVSITVSNWGLEIPEDEREKIYIREFRGEKAKDFVPSGSGIGLFLAKEIVDMHNAKLELLTGTAKYNTIFRIIFPKEGK